MTDNSVAHPGLELNFDVVFCIDVTRSIQPLIETVKSNMLNFADDLRRTLEERDRSPSQIRVRIVAFGDCSINPESLRASPFFTVIPDLQKSEMRAFVSTLHTNESENEQTSGLEALAVAMASDWVQEGDRKRHIIVMFTDASAHRLEDRVGDVPAAFAAQIPTSLDTMANIWEGEMQRLNDVTITLKQVSRRLVLLAPDMYPWSTIGDNWAQTVFFPLSDGEPLTELDYNTVIEILANSV